MKQHALNARILLESRTFQLMLEQILASFQINSFRSKDVDCLFRDVETGEAPDLIFIGKESAIKAGMTPTEFIESLRAQFHGPILLLSTDQDIENIEHYVSSGITDVFSPTEFDQIENFIANFISFQHSIADVENARVLLVEDSRSVTTMITELFAQHNIEVMFVPTGREALTVLHFEQVDLVITDYMLEGDMTGLALIRNIRRTTQWYSLPILAITGYNDPERNKELLRNGVSDIMHKPFDIELFLIKCQNLIKNKRTFQMLMDKQQAISNMSQRDALTGLYNRAYLTTLSERFIETNCDSNKPLFLIHLDCDDLKVANNKLGHDGADNVLKTIANLLQNSLDKDAILARLDGDEFMVSLPDYTFDRVLQIADLLRETVAQHSFEGDSMTVSIGVSGGSGEHSFSEIYLDTDKAVLRAKSGGKNQVALGDFMAELMTL